MSEGGASVTGRKTRPPSPYHRRLRSETGAGPLRRGRRPVGAARTARSGGPDSVPIGVSRSLWICLALAAAGGLVAAREAVGDEPAEPTEPTVIHLEAAPPSAGTQRLMRRWHEDARDRVAPVLRAWESVTRAARERPGVALTAGCRRLDLALGELRRDRLPPAPDPSVSLHLEETLRVLAEAAESCTQGAWFLTSWRLRRADAAWHELRGRLLLYELTP